MAIIKSKIVSEGLISGIVVGFNNGESVFIEKSQFDTLTPENRVFQNAVISKDGRILPKKGLIIPEVAEKLIVLYHGSDRKVPNPKYDYGSMKNDYGVGFYCTENKNLACEWACKSGASGYLNKYNFCISGLNVLNLGSRKYEDIMSWLAILLENRTFTSSGIIASRARHFIRDKYFSKDYRNYDVIIGYRADDSYFRYADDFISGVISYEKFSSAIFLGKLGVQVVLISRLAFSMIRLDSIIKVDEKYTRRYVSRDTKARQDYSKLRDTGNLLITDIMQRGY